MADEPKHQQTCRTYLPAQDLSHHLSSSITLTISTHTAIQINIYSYILIGVLHIPFIN